MSRRHDTDSSLRCSFCHKSKGAVGKLISSPSDYPRAYICDECIAVCNSILSDDKLEALDASPHPALFHPQASEFMTAVEQWMRRESLGGDASEELEQVRTLALRLGILSKAETDQ